MSDSHDPSGPLTAFGQTPAGRFLRGQREQAEQRAEINREAARQFERMHGASTQDTTSAPPGSSTAWLPDVTLTGPAGPLKADEQSRQLVLAYREIARHNIASVRLKPADPTMAFSYLREDGTINSDGLALNEPELVTRDEHERRLRAAYRDCWERSLAWWQQRLGNDLRLREVASRLGVTLQDERVAEALRQYALARERLTLLERGRFIWPWKPGDSYDWPAKYYWYECYLFRRCLFRIRNPLVRKVGIEKFDRLIRGYIARQYRKSWVFQNRWLKHHHEFKPFHSVDELYENVIGTPSQ